MLSRYVLTNSLRRLPRLATYNQVPSLTRSITIAPTITNDSLSGTCNAIESCSLPPNTWASTAMLATHPITAPYYLTIGRFTTTTGQGKKKGEDTQGESTSKEGGEGKVPRQGYVVQGTHGPEPVASTWIDTVARHTPRAAPFLRLLRADRPIGTLLLLHPCLWSLGLAGTPGTLPSMSLVAAFATGAWIMRGAGCIVNDLWDQDIDSKVARTVNRPLANGDLTRKQAYTLLLTCLTAGFGVLCTMNTFSIVLGASSLLLVGVYPVMKRITYWPQAFLGLTFNWGALLGWASVHGSLDYNVVLPLYVSGIAWTLFYDTIYAHQDKVDDLVIGVKSTALRLGDNSKPWLAAFATTSVVGVLSAGYTVGIAPPFYLCMAAGATHLGYQLRRVDLDDPLSCLAMFKANQWYGLLVTMAIWGGMYWAEEEEEEEGESKVIS